MIDSIIAFAPVMAAAADTAAAAGHAAAAGGGGAAYNGFFSLGMAGLGAGIGVGLVGLGAAQSVGRNPTAFGKILTSGSFGMALAEAIAIYGLLMALQS